MKACPGGKYADNVKRSSGAQGFLGTLSLIGLMQRNMDDGIRIFYGYLKETLPRHFVPDILKANENQLGEIDRVYPELNR